jgi:hypothetical protein
MMFGTCTLAVFSLMQRVLAIFQAHVIGELLLPLVIRRQAPKQLRKSEQPLTELLERGAYAR